MVYSSDALQIWYSWRILNIKIYKEEEKVKLIHNLMENLQIIYEVFHFNLYNGFIIKYIL